MANVTRSRPLSPHLQVYKPIPTMVMSIVHRITGAALYFGTVLVAFWLIAAASGEAYFEWANWLFGSLIGRLVLFGYTWALFQHMCGGLRHLVWDTGAGLERETRLKLGWATLIGSLALTALAWVVYFLR